MSTGDPYHTQIFAARLRPHRSLSQRNFRLLFVIFSAAAFFTSLPFLILGAWPVAGFMGLDVVLLYWAFRANFRDACAYEDVIVTPLEIAIAKVPARGAPLEWRFNPLWVRLDRSEDEEFGLRQLRLVSRGRDVEVAHYLDPESKAVFARELGRALAEARRGPKFS